MCEYQNVNKYLKASSQTVFHCSLKPVWNWSRKETEEKRKYWLSHGTKARSSSPPKIIRNHTQTVNVCTTFDVNLASSSVLIVLCTG